MGMSSAERIPEEIIVDILTRLPAKSVGKFRCVSKQWCSLLSDPKFIKAHLTLHYNQEQDKLILAVGYHSFLSITFNHNPLNGYDLILRPHNFQHLSEKWVNIGGSCNGLVLVENTERIQFLINPTTFKYHEIPKFDMALPVDRSFRFYGLGYDVTDDYKVVTLSHYYRREPDITFVDVYSVRKGIWRRLEDAPFNPVTAHAVSLNGALHYLAFKLSADWFGIISFDLSDEKFLEVPPPTAFIGKKGDFLLCKLVALRGCLSMFSNGRTNETDVWMMKDYGVQESWTKFIVKGPETYLTPLCLISEDDVVIDAKGELIIYNTREAQWRNKMIFDGIPAMLEHTRSVTFRESLVSPVFG